MPFSKDDFIKICFALDRMPKETRNNGVSCTDSRRLDALLNPFVFALDETEKAKFIVLYNSLRYTIEIGTTFYDVITINAIKDLCNLFSEQSVVSSSDINREVDLK